MVNPPCSVRTGMNTVPGSGTSLPHQKKLLRASVTSGPKWPASSWRSVLPTPSAAITRSASAPASRHGRAAQDAQHRGPPDGHAAVKPGDGRGPLRQPELRRREPPGGRDQIGRDLGVRRLDRGQRPAAEPDPETKGPLGGQPLVQPDLPAGPGPFEQPGREQPGRPTADDADATFLVSHAITLNGRYRPADLGPVRSRRYWPPRARDGAALR